jgi:hypothetical protein
MAHSITGIGGGMKRFTGVRILTQALSESDLAIFIGKGICREAQPYVPHKFNLFMSDDTNYLISFALGIAMCTDKRVFVFCEDQYFIKNMSEFMQAGVSRCKNFFVVMFVNGVYTSVPATPTIFDSVSSQHGTLYNMGFLVHDYKQHFKNSRNPVKEIRAIWERMRGPLAVLLPTEKGNKNLPDISFSDKKSLADTKKFIMDRRIESKIFIPPMSLGEAL